MAFNITSNASENLSLTNKAFALLKQLNFIL